MNNKMLYENLNINISDNDFYEGLKEIIKELEEFYNNFDAHSMNDHILYERGQKDMLSKIITYLKQVLGE